MDNPGKRTGGKHLTLKFRSKAKQPWNFGFDFVNKNKHIYLILSNVKLKIY